MTQDKFRVGSATVQLIRGDITEIATDAIVNAANSSLMGGGGVDGAIHRKGGPTIVEECKKIRSERWPEGLPTGKAVITSGGNLNAKHVIHTVGPVWQGGNLGEATFLRDAYTNSLKLAVSSGLRTIAFPSISTGAYGYPVDQASRIAIKAIKDFLTTVDNLDEVIFVLFSDFDLNTYLEAAELESFTKLHSSSSTSDNCFHVAGFES
jgi:O-acetyl-ADP-ribose deacetylase (regulator of RNase III)